MGKIKLNAGKRKPESGRNHVAPAETDARTLPREPQPREDTQINSNGLN